MGKLFISVVSHGHDDLIIGNAALPQLVSVECVHVHVRDNIGSSRLEAYAHKCGFGYSSSQLPNGFGANNNAIFRNFRALFGASDEDLFCLLNPDVVIEPSVLMGVVEEVRRRQLCLATINLVQDKACSISDLNIKRFPSLMDFAKGFLLGINPAAYDKSVITEPCQVDWASGAFLLCRVDLFEQLGGFDERFFMYLEDVDICRRALVQCGQPLWYFPQFKAMHLCQQANKRVFSKHFVWFVTSMLKYFLKYRCRTRPSGGQ